MTSTRFADALRSLAELLDERLAQIPPGHTVSIEGPESEWRWVEPGTVIGAPRAHAFPLWDFGLQGTPEYEACEAAMRADPLIGPRVDQLVGSVSSAQALQPLIAINSLLADSITDGRISIEALDDEVERFLECFEGEPLAGRSFVGIFGVTVDGDPIELPGGVVVRSIEGGDLPTLVGSGVGLTCVLGPALTGQRRTVAGLPGAIAEVRFAVAAYSGEADPLQAGLPTIPDMSRIGDRIVESLSLITAARVARTGVINEDLHWFASGWSYGQHPQDSAVTDELVTLAESESRPLGEIFVQLDASGVTGRRFLSLALRRFTLAMRRTRDDDRLLDLAIAAEALLMGEGAELSLRLALRAAALAESANLPPRGVYDRMRDAYRVRSKLVHGDEVPQEKIEAARVGLESDLRSLLRAYVRMATEAGGTSRLPMDEAHYLPVIE